MTKTIFFLFAVFLSFNNLTFSQSSSISGSAFLEGTSDHSYIKIEFIRMAPSPLTYTIFSDSIGYYQIELENGIYNIYFSKPGYFGYEIMEQSVYSNLVLDDISLHKRTSLINVPYDIPTIQAAINEAHTNDTILVSEGVYQESLTIVEKRVFLTSNYLFTNDTNTIVNTIIDGDLTWRVLWIGGAASNGCEVSGFTIRNGKTHNTDRDGGGIYCDHSSPKLSNLIIENNKAIDGGHGGGIYCDNSNAIMHNLIIRNNYASDEGGGIMLEHYSNASLDNLTIYNNSAYTGGGISCEHSCIPEIYNSTIYYNDAMGGGGGIALEGNSPAIIDNNLIYGNIAWYCGGGISCYNSDAIINNSTIVKNYSNKGGGICLIVTSSPTITNSIIAYNTGNHGIENSSSWPGDPTILNCNFYENETMNFYNCGAYIGENVTTNINNDSCDAFINIQLIPNFIDTSSNNYLLDSLSSSIDAGDNSKVFLDTDIRNSIRIQDGNNDGTSIVDLGCYEIGDLIYGVNSDNYPKSKIKRYPNPFKNSISFDIGSLGPEDFDLKIFDLFGRCLKSISINKNNFEKIYWDGNDENGNSILPGTYFYKIGNNSGVIVKE